MVKQLFRFWRLPRLCAVQMIRFYQATLSPDHGLLRVFFPDGCCTYDETCSNFAKRTIHQRGLIVGGWLSLKRILSCTPWRKPDESMIKKAMRH